MRTKNAAIPTINASVSCRLISALKTERQKASQKLGKVKPFVGDLGELIANSEKALYASRLSLYAQAIGLLQKASINFDWDLDIVRVLQIWQAGCIIRSDLLQVLQKAVKANQDSKIIFLTEGIGALLLENEGAWRSVVYEGCKIGIPVLANYSALAYFDSYRSNTLPANLIQAQRDYFGAHSYRRLDIEGVFHTNWDGKSNLLDD